MNMKRFLGLAVAVGMTLGMASAANAKLPGIYGNKAANLQAMQWYAQQQAANGYGYGLYGYPSNSYYNNGYYNQNLYNPYLNNYNYANPYYGSLPGYYY